MGMTPLAGLMMGTRCGDLDPSVVNYLKYTLNITGHELDEILNKKSGLLGISGVSSDKRDVEEAALHGNKRAQLASDMLNYQIKKVVGSYIAAMGGVDAIVFTGGIGEHDEIARAKVCHHMDWLGIRIDTDKNEHPVGDVCEITAWGAKGPHSGHRYRRGADDRPRHQGSPREVISAFKASKAAPLPKGRCGLFAVLHEQRPSYYAECTKSGRGVVFG